MRFAPLHRGKWASVDAPSPWSAPGHLLRAERVPLGAGRRQFAHVAPPRAGAPPLLLLHGLGATGVLNFASVVSALHDRGRLLVPDLEGHGRGRRVGNRFSLETCADDAAGLLAALDEEPAIVVGYSMGGTVAQLLALRHPHRVAGLILCATARDFSGKTVERLRFAGIGAAAAAASWGPSALPGLVPVLPGPLRPLGWAASELRRHDPAGVLAAAAALGRFTSREWTHLLDPPAAVLVHERDRLVPPHRQRKLAAALPDAEVITVDTDHLGIADDPQRFVPALLRAHDSVLARIEARRPARRGAPVTPAAPAAARAARAQLTGVPIAAA